MKVIGIVVSLLLLSTLVSAHEETRNPEDIISSVMAKQGITNIKQIACSKISNEDFETLGDAMMEKMVGNHELHEQMDTMMGGEGSASLKQMHIIMGSNWLGCTRDMPMMGLMMPMMMRMMGNYYPAYYAGYDNILLVAIIGWILFGATLAYSFSKVKKRKR